MTKINRERSSCNINRYIAILSHSCGIKKNNIEFYESLILLIHTAVILLFMSVCLSLLLLCVSFALIYSFKQRVMLYSLDCVFSRSQCASRPRTSFFQSHHRGTQQLMMLRNTTHFFRLTYDDLHCHVTVAVIGMTFLLRLLLSSALLLLQHDGVEVAPLLHQLAGGRVAHLEGLTGQRATEAVGTQDHCGRQTQRVILGDRKKKKLHSNIFSLLMSKKATFYASSVRS